MKFSFDGKYVIGQSGGPDWTLYYWSWERTKLMASTKTASIHPTPLPMGVPQTSANASFGTAVYQVMFNPTDNSQVSVVGNGIFKLLRYQEGAFKPVSLQKFEMRVSFFYVDIILLLELHLPLLGK